MRVNTKHRLVAKNGQAVRYEATNNKGVGFANGQPSYLIIHYTSGGTADGSITWFKNPKSEASAHLVIDHDGAITQMVPFDTTAWHAGESFWRGLAGLNKFAIGIEIVNWGLLHGSAGAWRNRVGGIVPNDRVILAKHKNFEPTTLNAWEMYDEAQMVTALEAASAIVRHYSIPEANLLGHDDVSPGRKQDPGPAFHLERFRAQLFGRASDGDTVFRVVSSTGLNLRTGPGTTFPAIELLPDGARVRQTGSEGAWFEVATLNSNGQEDKTGWVNSRWLASA